LILLFFISENFAQTDTLQTDGVAIPEGLIERQNTANNGGFGAIMYRYGIIDGKKSFINGGKGGVIFNHNFAIGAQVMSFRSESINDTILNGNYRLTGAYIGSFLEPIFFSRNPIHFSIPIMIGAGWISYASPNFNSNKIDEDTKAFLIIEPGIEVEFNMVRFLHISLGAYYSITTPVLLNYESGKLIDVRSNALNNLSLGVTLKFGKF